MKKNLAIILAGGSGSRIKQEIPKQFLMLGNRTILQHSITRFENHPAISSIYIVIHKDFTNKTRDIISKSNFKKVVNVLPGGQTRQDSSRIGVSAAAPHEFDNILIHDAARPLVTKEIIDRILKALEKYDAINVAIPTPDTMIEIDDTNRVKHVLERSHLRRVQTPQAFKGELIVRAHRLAIQKGISNATDDCSLILELNLGEIYVVDGSPTNIKITYPEDIPIAEKIIANK